MFLQCSLSWVTTSWLWMHVIWRKMRVESPPKVALWCECTLSIKSSITAFGKLNNLFLHHYNAGDETCGFPVFSSLQLCFKFRLFLASSCEICFWYQSVSEHESHVTRKLIHGFYYCYCFLNSIPVSVCRWNNLDSTSSLEGMGADVVIVRCLSSCPSVSVILNRVWFMRPPQSI